MADNGAGPITHVINGKEHGGGIEIAWVVDDRNRYNVDPTNMAGGSWTIAMQPPLRHVESPTKAHGLVQKQLHVECACVWCCRGAKCVDHLQNHSGAAWHSRGMAKWQGRQRLAHPEVSTVMAHACL